MVLSGLAALGLWLWAHSGAVAATDNAYVGGDITALAPKVGGYVVSVAVKDNQAVRVGDVLFRIDDRDYRARLAQAQATLDAVKARLEATSQEIGLQQALVRQAQAERRGKVVELGLATRTSDRRSELVEGGAVSQAQFDESQAAAGRAKAAVVATSAALEAQRRKIDVLLAQLQTGAATVAQAEAARDLARIDLENTVVRAPVAGVVGNRQVRVGRLVAPGSPVLAIVPLADVYVVANFKETQLEHIQPGQPALVEVDGYPAHALKGVVDSLAPASGATFSLIPPDNATGNFVRVVQRVSVKIRLRNRSLQGRLVPGLSARVRIEPGSGA
jgi:membrane fusion protein (multidrug efflux system)